MKKEVSFFVFSQLVSYGIIGVFGTLIHTGTLWFFVEYLNLNPLSSSIIGFTLSLLISYFLNTKYTFKTKSKRATFVRYCYVSIFGLIINLLILSYFQYYLDGKYMTGQFLAIVIVPVVNFIFNKFWTFKSKVSTG